MFEYRIDRLSAFNNPYKKGVPKDALSATIIRSVLSGEDIEN